MDQPTAGEASKRLEPLIGEWSLEAEPPDGPPWPGEARATIEWHDSGAHLVQRSMVDMPEAPDGVSIMGCDAANGTYFQLYSDERGVCRVYEMSIGDGRWELWREGEPFPQRFTATISEDGNKILGRWEKVRMLGVCTPAGTTRVACLPDEEHDMRILVTVSPRIYRESVASSIQSARPDLEVRAASPEEADLELAGFEPHVLVHNDALPVPREALDGVPCRVEMPYSDGMDARVSAGGEVSRVRDISTEDLLRTVAVTATVGGTEQA